MKRFNYFQNRLGEWIVEDIVDDKYIISIPKFIGFENEEGAKVFCDLLNGLYDECCELKKMVEDGRELL